MIKTRKFNRNINKRKKQIRKRQKQLARYRKLRKLKNLP